MRWWLPVLVLLAVAIGGAYFAFQTEQTPVMPCDALHYSLVKVADATPDPEAAVARFLVKDTSLIMTRGSMRPAALNGCVVTNTTLTPQRDDWPSTADVEVSCSILKVVPMSFSERFYIINDSVYLEEDNFLGSCPSSFSVMPADNFRIIDLQERKEQGEVIAFLDAQCANETTVPAGLLDACRVRRASQFEYSRLEERAALCDSVGNDRMRTDCYRDALSGFMNSRVYQTYEDVQSVPSQNLPPEKYDRVKAVCAQYARNAKERTAVLSCASVLD
jgi:hypothetical protein